MTEKKLGPFRPLVILFVDGVDDPDMASDVMMSHGVAPLLATAPRFQGVKVIRSDSDLLRDTVAEDQKQHGSPFNLVVADLSAYPPPIDPEFPESVREIFNHFRIRNAVFLFVRADPEGFQVFVYEPEDGGHISHHGSFAAREKLASTIHQMMTNAGSRQPAPPG